MMATTKIWAIKGSLADALSYAKNPDKTGALKAAIDYASSETKTQNTSYVTGVNCSSEDTLFEMQLVKKQYAKEGGIIAHHAVQSFAPGEITPEKAHELGVRFANDMWGDRFQVLVCTHLDKEHIHSHFILNSVSFVDGKKYNGCKKTYRKIREISDELCRQEGLSIVELPLKKGVSRAEYNIEKDGRISYRAQVRMDIDQAISKAISMEGFYGELRNMGYSLKFGKHIAVKMPGKEKYIRLRSLADDMYTPDGIRKRIADNYSDNYGIMKTGKRKVIKCRRPRRKLTGYKALYFKYLFLLGKIPSRRRYTNQPYHISRQVRELNKISRQARLIFINDINDSKDVRSLQKQLSRNLILLEDKREEKRKQYRRVQPEHIRQKTKQDIAELTEKIRKARQDINTCKQILEQAGAKSNLEPKKHSISKSKRSEVRGNEHGSRNRGDDR